MAQDSSRPHPPKSSFQPSPEQPPPFDKLDLTAFLAAGPYSPYAAQVIRERGVDFTPEDPFLLSYPSTQIQRVLAHPPLVRPEPLPQNRQRALILLKKVANNIRDERCSHAEEDLQEAIRLAPDSAGLHFVAAVCAMSLNNLPQIEKESRESLRQWPSDAEAHILLAYALNCQGRGAEAVPEAREALGIFPTHKGAIMELGIALSRSGQHSEAIPILKQSSAINHQATLVDKFLGYSLLEVNQPSEAVGPLTFYLQRVPTDAEAHYLLGTALRAAKSKDAAQSQFDEALKLEPQNARFQAAAHPDAIPASSGTPSPSKLDLGSVSGNVYSNDFFQFTYEFPDGWTVLSSEAGRAIVEIGGALLSTGDPTEPETKRVALQRGYPLLTLIQQWDTNQPLVPKLVQILAIDAYDAPNMDPISLQTAIIESLKQSGSKFDLQDGPKNVSLGGKNFANAHFIAHVADRQAYTSQFVMKEKGFLLLINLSTPDQASLSGLENSLNSLHFLESPN
jgi:Flp pilus assembly protein TadD